MPVDMEVVGKGVAINGQCPSEEKSARDAGRHLQLARVLAQGGAAPGTAARRTVLMRLAVHGPGERRQRERAKDGCILGIAK